MKAIEILSGHTVAPGFAAFSPAIMAGGDTLSVRNAVPGSKIYLLGLWGCHQAIGNIRLRSPNMHDNVEGIRILDIIGAPTNMLPLEALQNFNPQDTLILEMTGSAGALVQEMAHVLIGYDDLPGIEGRFINADQLKDKVACIVAIENPLVLAAGPNYSGQVAINATFDLLKANTDYALIGYHVDALCGAVCWRGADSGNIRIGAPGNPTHKEHTGEYFINLSKKSGLPCIPVFNSSNKAAIFVDGYQDENAGAVVLTSIFVQLKS